MADDRALWESICRGDANAFGLFYEENAGRLRAFLCHLVGDAQVAEDIMQETFMRMWVHPNGFRPERGCLRAYLFGIARHLELEWFRREGAARSGARNESAVETEETHAEEGSSIRQAFSRLAEEQRTLLWLREVEGQSYAELAEVLSVPVGTIRSRLFAARAELRAVWHGKSKNETRD